MMNHELRDKLIQYLFTLMAEHVERGCDYDEALILGVEEIRRQIRQSRGDLVEMLIGQAVHTAHNARESLTKLH